MIDAWCEKITLVMSSGFGRGHVRACLYCRASKWYLFGSYFTAYLMYLLLSLFWSAEVTVLLQLCGYSAPCFRCCNSCCSALVWTCSVKLNSHKSKGEKHSASAYADVWTPHAVAVNTLQDVNTDFKAALIWIFKITIWLILILIPYFFGFFVYFFVFSPCWDNWTELFYICSFH